MGFFRHLIVLWVAAASIAACTWGTYDGGTQDGGPGSDSGGGTVPVDPQVGANIVSSDGVFEVDFPPGVFMETVYARITQAPPQGKFAGAQSYGFDYAVQLSSFNGGAPVRLQHPVVVIFHLGKSTFGIPPEELFILAEATGATLPGAFASSPGSDVFGVQQAPGGQVQGLGPYLAVHGNLRASAGGCGCNQVCGQTCSCGTCGCATTLGAAATFDACYSTCPQAGPQEDVCSACMRSCCGIGTATTSPQPTNGLLSRACYCASNTPSVVACMRSCVEGGNGSQCL